MAFNYEPEIILVNTQIPENLGFVARAMLNFGLKKLRLVSPKFELTNEKIIPLAAGADKIIENMKVYSCYSKAINDFNFLIACTTRDRELKKVQLSPKEAVNEALSNTKVKNKVGFVFGPEKSGLTNSHLSVVDNILTIKANPEFSSINLSHAVIIVCYEWMKLNQQLPNKRGMKKKVKKEKLLFFFNHLEQMLDQSGFIKTLERKEKIILKIKNIFSKNQLEDNEIDILLGIFSSLFKSKKIK